VAKSPAWSVEGQFIHMRILEIIIMRQFSKLY
jgi:hypothetical protein